MRGPTSSFLDRVHQDTLIDDRSRLADEVRSVFHALVASMAPGEAERWVERLPSDLESLWKPPYFEVIRSREDAGDDPGAATRASRPVELLRRRLPPERRSEADDLMRAVLTALGDRLPAGERDAVGRGLPGELSGLVSSTSSTSSSPPSPPTSGSS